MKFLEWLKSMNEWRKEFDWFGTSKWVRDHSGITLIILAGVVNSKKLSEIVPGLPDVDLTAFINIAFWTKVEHWAATALVVALIVNSWSTQKPPVAKP